MGNGASGGLVAHGSEFFGSPRWKTRIQSTTKSLNAKWSVGYVGSVVSVGFVGQK
jgi:hypothetical protein